MKNFQVLLLGEVSAIDSNATIESVENVVGRDGLSWEMFEYQRKEDIVEKLKAIDNLDESHCAVLFDKLNEMRPTELNRKHRDCILSIKSDFYEKWIMKCMYSAFNAFECFCC